jgi:hypothetical protein
MSANADANLAGLATFLSGFYDTKATLDLAAVEAAGSATRADLLAIFDLVRRIAAAWASPARPDKASMGALVALCERAFVFELDPAGAETMRLRRADEAPQVQ